jgi:hypothetical protein
VIAQLHRSDYSDRNRQYNQRIVSLVDDMLGTHLVYPEYVPIKEFTSALPSAAQAHKEIHVVKGIQDPPAKSTAQFDRRGLDLYEQVVFTSLAWGNYGLYCLVGEMGSGKTALTTQLKEVLERRRPVECGRCSACIPIVIRLDFNEGFADAATDTILARFERRLYAQLKAQLSDRFRNDFNVDAFVVFARKREAFTSLADFHDFAETCQDDEKWRKATNKQRADQLFAHIKSHEDLGYQLELLMRLLGYARSQLLPEPACIVMIYDNLDKIKYEAQMEILYAVMSYQHMANVRALVPLRRTSFEKLASQRVYSFGAINHTGPSPLEIIRRRLDHYSKNFDTDRLTSSLDPSTAAALRRRVNYVLSIVSHNTGYVVDTLRSIPGDSVRLGLFMMVRAFVNNTLPYDTETSSTTDVVRAALVGDNEDGHIAFNDDVVANIFHDGHTGAPSLLCVRILSLLKAFQDASSKRTLGNLIAILREVGGWSVRDVLLALNYLMNTKRPLVWADGRTQFGLALEKKGEIPSKEILFLSSAGELYLRVLASQLAYFQECVICLEWRSENVPSSFDASNIDSRMSMVRACFVEIQAMDIKQCKRFVQYKERNAWQLLPLVVFSNRMLYGLATAALRIFRKHHENSGLIADEWRSWHDQILQSINTEAELAGGKRNDQLTALEASFRSALSEVKAI